MEGLSDNAAEVPVDCDSGHDRHLGTVYERVVDGRLHWVLEVDCDGPVEAMGWDETPSEYRDAILEQCGVFRLRVTTGAARVAMLKVLRDHGLALGEAAGTLDLLQGSGLSGTRAELELLAARLRTVGTVTEVVRP